MARKKSANKIWRFQVSTTLGANIVSAMTRDRQWAVHFPIDAVWQANFRDRTTFYAEADLVGPPGQHRLRLRREVTEEDWT